MALTLAFDRAWKIITRVMGVGALTALPACAVRMEPKVGRTEISGELRQRGYAELPPVRAEAVPQLPPGVNFEDGVTEAEAIAIALWNNAGFQAALAQLGFARADLLQAGLFANPTLSMLFPVGVRQLELNAALPLEALWLRPKRVAIAELDAERVARELVQHGLDLARDVRGALVDVDLARERVAIARESVGIREEIVTISGNRLKAGDTSELEALAARAEWERAREEAGSAQREEGRVRERLSLLLGWSLGQTQVMTSVPGRPTVPDLMDLEKKSLAARPEIRAAELALESAGKKVGLADREIFALSLLAKSTTGSGKEGIVGPGLALPVPILNQNEPARMRARAELERAAWNFAGVRDRVLAEVRDARSRWEIAEAAVEAYEARVLPPLVDVDRVVRRAFELGEISPLSVQDNARQLLAARLRAVELRAESRRAIAELERSVGTRLTTPNTLISTPK